MSLRIASVKGIPIRLHFTLIITIALITFTLATSFMPLEFPGLTPLEYWVIGIIGAIILFASVLVHEIAHSIVALSYGIEVRQIVLFVFGGVSDISEDLKDSRKEMKMAAAGPVTSFILAAIFAAAWLIASSIAAVVDGSSLAIPILYYGAFLNAILGAFNLIPAFPSDGGRILRAYLVRRNKDYNEATKSAARVGIAISYLFMGFGFITMLTGQIIGGIWILLIGWFLRSGAESYLEQIRLTSVLSRVHLRDIMNTNVISIRPSSFAQDLLHDYFNKYMRSAFPVVDDHNKLLGLVTLARVLTVPKEKLSGTTAQEVMVDRNNLIVMKEHDTAENALMKMTRNRMGKIFVCDEFSGELLGMVTKTDLLSVETERQEIAKILQKSA